MTSTSERQRRSTARNLKERVLDAAERLFGEFGLGGVSMRQIAAAAGSKSHLTVQYHFGGKEGIALAILERRLPSLERHRARLLAEAKAAGRLHDSKCLLNVILRPIAHETDTDGRLSYAAFLLGVNRHRELRTLRKDLRNAAPLTDHVVALFRDTLERVPDLLFEQRLLCATDVYLQCVLALDDPLVEGGWISNELDALSEALEIAHAVLAAPVVLRSDPKT